MLTASKQAQSSVIIRIAFIANGCIVKKNTNDKYAHVAL